MDTPRKRRPVRTYADLPAKPIMLYPESGDERDRFKAAARDAGFKRLGPFIRHVVNLYCSYHEERRSKAAPPGPVAVAPYDPTGARERLERARQRLRQSA
jgi:hypothetical protein